MPSSTPRTKSEATSTFARHGWLGLLLIAVFWTPNWGLDGLRKHMLLHHTARGDWRPVVSLALGTLICGCNAYAFLTGMPS